MNFTDEELKEMLMSLNDGYCLDTGGGVNIKRQQILNKAINKIREMLKMEMIRCTCESPKWSASSYNCGNCNLITYG